MAVKWVDRVATHPGRVQLTPVVGQTNIYDMERADEPTVAGTPINAANLNAMQKNVGLDANMTVYVAVSGSDATGNGSSTSPYQTITKALSVIPKNLNGYLATVNISAGTYDEDINIWGFCAGSIMLTGVANAIVSVKSMSVGQTTSLRLENINLSFLQNAEFYTVYIVESVLNQRSGKMSISNTSPGGVYANTGALVYLNELAVSNTTSYCVTSANNSKVHIQNATLSTAGSGLVASYGGVITYTTITNSATVKNATLTGGRIYSGSQTSIPNY